MKGSMRMPKKLGQSGMSGKEIGVMLTILGGLFFSLISVMFILITDMSATEKLFFRSLIGCFVIIAVIKKNKIEIKFGRPKMHFLRGLTGFLAAYLSYSAVAHLPLSEASTLLNLFPFFVVLLSSIILKERIKSWHVIALIMSFMGTIFVIKPGFGEFNIFFLVAILSAFLTGAAHITIKMLRETERAEIIVLSFAILSTVFSFVMMLVEGFVVPQGNQIIYLLILGLVATGYQECISAAYKFAPAGELSIYSYSTIIFSAIFSIIIWKEALSIGTVIGIICIIGAGAVLFFNRKK